MAKTFKFLPHMCKQQREEIESLLHAADDIGAAAVSVAANSGQGYNLLLEARDRFKEILMECASHYRICLEEDEEQCAFNPSGTIEFTVTTPSFYCDDVIC